MLGFFRNLVHSKVGAGIVLALLVLIAFAFASADVAGSGGFGGIAGGDRVAKVGKARIDTSTLSLASTNAVEGLKKENPKLSMKAFISMGGLDRVLSELIDANALSEFGRLHGIVASDRLVDSEIAKMDRFKTPDGKFSQAAFQQALSQQGLTEKLFREDITQRLVGNQLLAAASYGAVMPQDLVSRYAGLLTDHRSGSIAMIPSAAFAGTTPPTDAELQAFYARNSNRFIRPERRVIRYVTFGEAALKSVPTPNDAEIAARYNANKAQYGALETRSVTQVIVPTQAAAAAIAAELAKGQKLEAAVAGKGLSTALIGPVSKVDLASQTSAAVADAVFAAAKGSLAAPARSPLGWHVARIDAVTNRPERSLDQVRGEIVALLSAEKRRAAINDLSARFEEEFNSGGTLTEAAKELGLTIETSEPLTADGQVYGRPDQKAPAVLGPALQAAFAMEGEGEPQLAELEAGKTFMIFDVSEITASAAAPLAEIRGDVATGVMLEKGAAAAKAAADRVVAAARKGTDLGAAMASLGRPMPPVDRVSMGRQEMAAMGQRTPPPFRVLFSMAQGTVKLLPAPNNRGWYIIALSQIVPGQVAAGDPRLAQVRQELGRLSGMEYAAALRRAAQQEVGVERNQAAIRAVRSRLTGAN